MKFNRRFHESEDVDWDSVADGENDYGKEFTCLADWAHEADRSEQSLRAVLNLAIKYPVIQDESMNFDKSKVRQIIKGISKAVDLGYIRKVYEINEMFTNGFGWCNIWCFSRRPF